MDEARDARGGWLREESERSQDHGRDAGGDARRSGRPEVVGQRKAERRGGAWAEEGEVAVEDRGRSARQKSEAGGEEERAGEGATKNQ